jgi:hypothetical protein
MLPNNVAPFSAIPANASKNSAFLWADKMLRVSVQAVATAANVGSIQMQFSNDAITGSQGAQVAPTNWTNLGSPVTLSGTTPVAIPYMEVSYEYLRLVYTDASSGTATGTVTARLVSKGL